MKIKETLTVHDENKKKKIKYLESLAEQIKANIRSRKRPLIVEFAGLPKAGKTTVIKSLSLFLRRNNLHTIVVQERASMCPIKKKEHPDFNTWTGCTSLVNILDFKQSNECCVIIVDRGIFDSIIWINLLNKRGKLKKADLKVMEAFFLLERWRKHIDMVIYMYSDIETALKREYKDLLTEKTGSIMNRRFLGDYISVASDVMKRHKRKFKNIIPMDTTNTDTIQGVEKVITLVIKCLQELSDEEIVLIPKSKKNDKIPFTGFDGSEETVKQLEILIKKDSIVKIRSAAEKLSEYIQIVVCAIIMHKNRIMLFTKREISKDRRFHNKHMIWIGGHLQKKDLKNKKTMNSHQFVKSLANCLKRELDEEIELDLDVKPELKGLVYDVTHSRSILHLGVVFLITLKNSFNYRSYDYRTFKELSGQEVDIEFVPINQDFFSKNINEIEPWSSAILKSLFKINLRVPKDYQQMRIF